MQNDVWFRLEFSENCKWIFKCGVVLIWSVLIVILMLIVFFGQ